ncbi:hypothetical protein [Kaarinaea lacus]
MSYKSGQFFNLTLTCMLLLLTVLMATGCSDSTSLPPERPKGVISGKVVDGAISGAQVTLYSFANGARGQRLAGSTTDADGNYSAEVQAPSQPILIEATGGSYVEQATGMVVTVPDGNSLRAIVNYQSGQPVDTMVTPLTHLVAGLTAYNTANGTPVSQAYSQAKAAVDEYFTIDTSAVIPIDINNSDSSVSAVSSEALYGFYLGGLSSWSLWASNRNQVTPHSIYTSIGVTQIMYNDIEADGKLDGIGFDIDRNNLMPLAVGVVPLNTETYRAAFSLHMLAVSNIPGNTTNLKPGDLQLTAEDLATRSSSLFTDQNPLDLDNQAPTLNPAQSLQPTYGGTMTLPLDIGGFLGAETISMALDGTSLGNLPDLLNPVVTVDTTIFTDGDHTISLSAIDALGHAATTNLNVVFDNTNPVVNVTSSGITNSTTPIISGTYSDNLSDVSSITVGGQAATVNENGTWEASVTISPGENIIPISIIDNVNNRTDIQTTVFLDDIPPAIDTTNGHSSVRFSDGNGGFFTAQLLDSNDSTPLFLETNRLDLGSTPITRPGLNTNLIPFFAFRASDDRAPSIPTPFSDITVRMRYEKNGTVIEDWRVLPVPGVGDEYLIPLASETLSLQWHQATPAEPHVIRVEVSDPAGNITEQVFSFRAEFYVPTLASGEPIIQDLNPISGVDFAQRETLNEAELDTITYTFDNPSGKAIYIQPTDISTHTVAQSVAEELRHHLVTKTTAAQWRVGLAESRDAQGCPIFDESQQSWQTTSSIYNWNASLLPIPDWEQRLTSEIMFSPVDEEIFMDDLASLPASSAWSPAPDFDTQYLSVGSGTITYDADYRLFPFGASALIINAVSNGINCPDQRHFDQRETYSYISLSGYPRDEVTNQDLTGLPDFSTTGFTVVVDGDIANPVQPVNGGWYLIPANAQVTITKRVTTPALTVYEDDFAGNASYTVPSRRDLTISWFVNRELGISMIHNTGEINIPDMPQRQSTTGTGTVNYQINR